MNNDKLSCQDFETIDRLFPLNNNISNNVNHTMKKKDKPIKWSEYKSMSDYEKKDIGYVGNNYNCCEYDEHKDRNNFLKSYVIIYLLAIILVLLRWFIRLL